MSEPVAEARALERGARSAAQEAKRRVLDWPRRRRMLVLRTVTIALCLVALTLWAWPLVAVLTATALAWTPPRTRRASWLWRELTAGSRADLRAALAAQARAIEAHSRALALLVAHDPDFDAVSGP